ncbi:sugar phosphate isomerase/epimerase family protein [Paenibacillus periandrae]|uniref:sugar phosphate isomerase/epimerase family protein n=1 Tax=Paenibacillus periandrae TaxID=1761741 RepID=UPI001F08E09D|nr:sugar phosphate isomerase/epimerase family protein [Paenibacillus periandrae]
MKLSISNIAWSTNEDNEISEILNEFNVTGIEVAPTKVYHEPENVNDSILQEYLNYWTNKNKKIIAMQSLLFNKSQLSIFGETNKQTLSYLKSIIFMGSRLSATSLVFGSPKNRFIGNNDPIEARREAITFFKDLGDIAKTYGISICIEANPVQYGCDFITSTLEALQFVKDIDHQAIKLQIDTGTMIINQENPYETLKACLPFIGHFHISEPYLELIGKNDHSEISYALKKLNYDGWVSIEMKNNLTSDNLLSLRQALGYVTQTYLN